MEFVPFAGRERNVRIVSGQAEMLVTADVGPRILSFGPTGGINLMFQLPNDGPLGSLGHKLYGGHRLWIAPEEEARTMQPDNDPVELQELEGGIVFRTPADTHHVVKELHITPTEHESFTVVHTLRNESAYDLTLSVWALSMLVPGTRVLFPQPPFESHQDRLLPTRPLTTWGYTRLADPRWTWGDYVAILQQDASGGPQKIGTYVDQGYAAAELNGLVLMKRFPARFGANYPDFGCNFETFTNEAMIEIESLSESRIVRPGEELVHEERWRLFLDERLPEDNEALGKRLAQLASLT